VGQSQYSRNTVTIQIVLEFEIRNFWYGRIKLNFFVRKPGPHKLKIFPYHSVQNLLPFSPFTNKNVHIHTERTVILPVELCGCESWCLAVK